MFREAHEFWKLHLNSKQHIIDEAVDIEPIEEVKIEVLDQENDAYPADYLEHTTEDVSFVEEPITVVDKQVTCLDIVKLEERDLWNNDESDNEKFHKSNIIIKENSKPMTKTTASVKRSVFDCDVEFLEDKTGLTTSLRPFAGGKSISVEGIPIFDCDMCDKGKFCLYCMWKLEYNQIWKTEEAF